MPEKSSSTILPKWPFLIGDIVLVILACFIVFASPKPMTGLTIFACELSVILGMLVFVTPYLIEHLTAQQSIKLKQAKAEETLLKAVELASDLLSRTETVHSELMKGILVTKQVPGKLEETAQEITALLASKEENEIKTLKEEIEQLKSIESEKLYSAISQLNSIADRIESIGPAESSFDSQESSKLTDSLIKVLKTETVSQTEAIRESLHTTLEELRNELLEVQKKTTTQSEDEPASIAEQDPDFDTPIPEIPEEEIVVNDTQEDSSPKFDAPVNGSDESIKDDNESPENESSEDDTEAIEESEPLVSKENSDGATRLLVGAFIGISNKLYIRGDGPGLDWEKGVPMELVGIGKWEWKTYDATKKVQCKVLINDEQWTDSENIDIEPNTTVETTASF